MIQIKNIFDSLRDDVLNGEMTLKEAAVELYESGHITYIDEEAARLRLHLAD